VTRPQVSLKEITGFTGKWLFRFQLTGTWLLLGLQAYNYSVDISVQDSEIR
jgi:hypothetical protein